MMFPFPRKTLALTSLALGMIMAPASRANDGIFPPAPATASAISFDGKGFTVRGKRTFIASGSIHYPRVPRALWRDRLTRLKRAGFNTVETYAFWNYHEPTEGQWDFSGEKDLGAFLDLAHKLGLYAIVRVGPYVCAEWDSGGYPVWLRFKPGVSVREDNTVFLRYTDRWYDRVIPIVAKRQVNRGGSVILVQLENEHPLGWGTDMPNAYFSHLLNKSRALGLEVPTFFSGLHHAHDPAGGRPWDSAARTNPWFSTEFWAGWFDRYGPADPGSLRFYDRATWKMLAYGGNGYNVYMLHGGTNFSQWGNQEDDASYDYGAAIGQAGDLRPLYYRFKRANLFAHSFANILENSENATEEYRDAFPGVSVTARKSAIGTLVFLDNPKDEEVSVRVGDVPIRIGPGEIVPVVRNAALAEGLRIVESAARILLVCKQGQTTTIVLYGRAREPGALTFRGMTGARPVPEAGTELAKGEDPATFTLRVNFTDGAPVEHGFTAGPARLRVLAVSTEMADRTWLVEHAGGPWIVCGPDYVKDAVERNGRIAFRAENRSGAAWMTCAYGPNGAARNYEYTANRPASRPADLGPWEIMPMDAPAQSGFKDRGWRTFAKAPEMGADGDISPYAWYRATVDVPHDGQYQLRFHGIRDRFRLYLDGKPVTSDTRRDTAGAGEALSLPPGRHDLSVFAVHDGRDKLVSYIGPLSVMDPKGLTGPVTLSPAPSRQSNVRGWLWRPANGTEDAKHLATEPATDTSSWQEAGTRDVFNGRRGLAVYRAELPSLPGKHIEAWFENVDDNATVYLNGQEIASHRGWGQPFGALLDATWKPDGANVLAVVVENTDGAGGIMGGVEIQAYDGATGALNGTPVGGWKLRGGIDSVGKTSGWARFGKAAGGPALYRTKFKLPAVDPGTVLRFNPGALGRGMAWLNGHNLGRYPDRLVPDGLYLPSCWLRAGENTLEVFDEEGKDPGPARLVVEGGASSIPVVYVERAPEASATVRPFAKEPRMIVPGEVWRDIDGKPIQAHGGGILARDGVYYWYGEDKTHGAGNAVGVHCYSSRDLVTWKDDGIVLPKAAVPEKFRDTGVLERPKVLYNTATGKYVMWMHLDADRYAVAQAGVAVADKPTGPFTFLSASRPIASSTFRDMNLFQDDDGTAYVFYAGEGNATMHIMRLNREYTAPELPMVEGKTWARAFIDLSREAPAPFKHRGRYYVVTSGCTGWAPNAADVAVADQILGPWTSLGNPCIGPEASTTFGAQSTFVLPAPGRPEGGFIFLADRWQPRDLADSRYVWLPFHIGADGRVTLPWRDRWNLDTFGG